MQTVVRHLTVVLIAAAFLVVPSIPRAQASRPAAAGQLVIAAPNTPKTLDFNSMSDYVEFESAWNTYDSLTGWKVNPGPGYGRADLSQVVPRLAKSWTISPDHRTYTFTLRRGVKSIFGNTLTANDVKWTWEADFADKGVGLFLANINNLASPKDVMVVNPYTVRFHLTKPSSIFLASLTLHAAGIFDSTEAKKHATPSDPYALAYLKNHDVGFGPYHVTQLIPDQEIDFTANPNYWGGKLTFQRVIDKVIPESAQRLQLLQRGAVDVADSLTPREYQVAGSSAGVHVYDVKPGWFATSLRINPTIKPFNNRLLREAIAYAVPYQAIFKDVYFSQGQIMRSYVPPQVPGYDPQAWQVHTDLTRARQLLQQAGYPHGLTVTFNYSAAVPEEEQVATFLKSSLAKIGINALLTKEPAARYTTGLFNHQFGFFIDTDSPFVPDASYASWLWFNPKSPIDYVHYNNPEVTSLIEQSLAESNRAKRLAMVRNIQRIIDNDYVWLYLTVPDLQVAVRNNVSGYNWVPETVLKWSELK